MGLVLTALGGRVCVLEAGHAVEDRDDPQQRQSLDKRRAERMHENALAAGSSALAGAAIGSVIDVVPREQRKCLIRCAKCRHH